MGEKLSFTIDAGVILAKLHRGGCQTRPDALFFNTGVINDKKVNPEQMDSNGDLTFDLEGGEYELGVILSKEDEIKLPEPPEKLADAQAGEDGEGKEDKKAAGDEEEEEEEEEEEKKDDGKAGGVKAITDKLTDEEKKKALNEDVTTLKADEIPADALKAIVGDPANAADGAKMDQILKKGELSQKVTDMLKKDGDAVKKYMESRMAVGAEYLKNYMKVFAGEEQANKIRPENIAVTYVPDKYADPYKNKKYDKYQIPAMTDAEVRQMKIEKLKDPKGNVVVLKNMCFKILYQLNVSK